MTAKAKDLTIGVIWLVAISVTSMLSILAFLPNDTITSSFSFFWPKERSLQLEISGKLSNFYQGVGSTVGTSYPFFIKVLATPASTQSPRIFQAKIERLKLFNQEKQLLLDYDSSAPDVIHYRTGSSISEEQRQQMYAFFQIDTGNQSIYQDHSLLRSSFRFALSEEGKLLELSLPHAWTKALLSHCYEHPFRPLLENILYHPYKLPLLGPIKGDSPWTTEGEILTPIALLHSAKKSKGGSLNIHSEGSSQYQTGETSIKQELSADWTYQEQFPSPNSLKINVLLDQSKALYATKANWRLEVDLHLAMQEASRKAVIPLLDIEKELKK